MSHRFELVPLREWFYRLVARYGFMEEADVPALLATAGAGLPVTIDFPRVTYFLGRESVLARKSGSMGRLAEGLFGYLQRNAVRADFHFQIPAHQAIEVGIQLDL